jgi:DNA-binding transcriptional ArsR family regulator
MIQEKAKKEEDLLCRVRTIHMDRVMRAKKEEIPAGELQRLAQTYKLLGDPTRLKIVMALKSSDMCVCDLAAFIGLSESAVSHQLRRLRDLAIVKHRREGQILYYSLDDAHIAELIEMGTQHVRE